MGNVALEEAEKKRGQHSICTVLGQLNEALSVVGAKAAMEKAAVDTARINAEVLHTGALWCQNFDVPGEPGVLDSSF